jgi:hypothetical protein
LQWTRYFCGFFEHGFGVRDFVGFSLGPSQAIEGGRIGDIVLSSQQCLRRLELGNGGCCFVLLGICITERGMGNSARELARLVGVGRVRLG